MKSENWGGIASLCGSLILAASGDGAGIMATAFCLTAEMVFALRGHRTWGYALGCALISLSGFFALASNLTEANHLLKLLIAAMMIVWGAGSLRWPLEQLAKSTSVQGIISAPLQSVANAIPRMIGVICLAMRLPLLASAAFSGEHTNALMLASQTCYLVADVLLGRLQNLVKSR